MITYNTIVEQIEKLAIEASKSTNEQYVREQLTAIRALCDVVLVQKNTQATKSQVITGAMNVVNSNSVIASTFAQPLLNSSQKLDEDDANGESLFDF
ncbi:MAG: YwdI family protein [Solibacillus sp.]|uniref:YwdI family protein n=1 Tax=unclassified Solibacillus TaxID=2637870 RepID=UPI0030F86F56